MLYHYKFMILQCLYNVPMIHRDSDKMSLQNKPCTLITQTNKLVQCLLSLVFVIP